MRLVDWAQRQDSNTFQIRFFTCCRLDQDIHTYVKESDGMMYKSDISNVLVVFLVLKFLFLLSATSYEKRMERKQSQLHKSL